MQHVARVGLDVLHLQCDAVYRMTPTSRDGRRPRRRTATGPVRRRRTVTEVSCLHSLQGTVLIHDKQRLNNTTTAHGVVLHSIGNGGLCCLRDTRSQQCRGLGRAPTQSSPTREPPRLSPGGRLVIGSTWVCISASPQRRRRSPSPEQRAQSGQPESERIIQKEGRFPRERPVALGELVVQVSEAPLKGLFRT